MAFTINNQDVIYMGRCLPNNGLFWGGGGRGGVFKVLESLKANIVVEIVFSYTSVLIWRKDNILTFLKMLIWSNIPLFFMLLY